MTPTIISYVVSFVAYFRKWPEWSLGLFIVLSCWGSFLSIGYISHRKSRVQKAVKVRMPEIEQPAVRNTKLTGQPSAQPWKSYTEDIISSILWQWGYWQSWGGDFIDRAINESSLQALCPKCKRELKETPVGLVGTSPSRSMKCPNCDFRSDHFDNGYFQFTQDILAEIRGRIRSGEYKKSLRKADFALRRTIYAKDLMKRWNMNDLDFINFIGQHLPSLYGKGSGKKGDYLMLWEST